MGLIIMKCCSCAGFIGKHHERGKITLSNKEKAYRLCLFHLQRAAFSFMVQGLPFRISTLMKLQSFCMSSFQIKP